MDISIFSFLGGSFDNALASLIGPATGRMLVLAAVIANSFLVVYMMIIGFGMVLGVKTKPLSELVTLFLMISVFGAVATQSATYTTYIVGFFDNIQGDLVTAITGNSDATGIYGIIDAALLNGTDSADKALAIAGDVGFLSPVVKFTWMATAFLIWLSTLCIVLVGGGGILVATVILKLLAIIGPVFIVLGMFPATRKFFDSFVSTVLNSVMEIVLISAALSLAIATYSYVLTQIDLTGGGLMSPVRISTVVVAISAILVFIIYQSGNKAASLAGGLSSAAFTLGAMANSIRSPARAVNNVVNPQSVRRDLQSGMQSKASRLDHIAAGNTLANPAYTRGLLSKIGKGGNWALKADGGKVKNKS